MMIKADVGTLMWRPPKGVGLKPLSTIDDMNGNPCLDSTPGPKPFLRGPRALLLDDGVATVCGPGVNVLEVSRIVLELMKGKQRNL